MITRPGSAQQTITVPPDVLAKTAVAVGTALAGGPPHRSQRAGLPHWAPASGSDGQALGWERVHHAGWPWQFIAILSGRVPEQRKMPLTWKNVGVEANILL